MSSKNDRKGPDKGFHEKILDIAIKWFGMRISEIDMFIMKI